MTNVSHYPEGHPVSHPPQVRDTATVEGHIESLVTRWTMGLVHPLILVTLVVAGGFFWAYRLPSVAMVGMAYYESLSTGFVFFGLVAAARVFLATLPSFNNNPEHRATVLRRPFWALFLTIVAATYSVIQNELPIRMAFFVSRPAFDALANEALNAPANANLLAGRSAGVYRVDEVEVIGRTVVFYLGEGRARYGFARVPNASRDLIWNRDGSDSNQTNFPKESPFNDVVGTRVTEDWFVVYSSYWRVKVGWS